MNRSRYFNFRGKPAKDTPVSGLPLSVLKSLKEGDKKKEKSENK